MQEKKVFEWFQELLIRGNDEVLSFGASTKMWFMQCTFHEYRVRIRSINRRSCDTAKQIKMSDSNRSCSTRMDVQSFNDLHKETTSSLTLAINYLDDQARRDF